MKICSALLQNGLGNILFNFSSAYGFSLKNGYNFCLYESLCLDSCHSKFKEYKTTIFEKFEFERFHKKNFFAFTPKNVFFQDPPKTEKNICFFGQIFNPIYFSGLEKEIYDSLSLNRTEFNGNGFCSVHVRRGDKLICEENYIHLDEQYYKKAMAKIPYGTKFLIFSDDIDFCKNLFTKKNRFLNIEFLDQKNKDFIDLELMSKCEHNIIANSTFSWWGAFLNQNSNKIVVSPKLWFFDRTDLFNTEEKQNKYIEELIPKKWITI